MPNSQPHPRRAVVLPEKTPAEIARALAAAGLDVRTEGDPCAPDVLLADPRAVAAMAGSLESAIATRAGELLCRLGDGIPDLHGQVMEQIERGLFRAVLAHTRNHLGRSSQILGLDRNTCARKARAFGLVTEPARGRKPAAKPAAPKPPKSGRGRKGAASKRA